MIEIFKVDVENDGCYFAKDTESNWRTKQISLDKLALEIYEKSQADTPLTGVKIIFPRTPQINVLGHSSNMLLPVPGNEVLLFYRELLRCLYLNDPSHPEL
ncbi:MAG: hypothetical protein UW30_C0016G0003 [Candidatus Giovannonibacteria bacterium GW2011_GWA2_44_13b]|uniref:Uncharacterized protein n=1 Tax=Candidatus Giovannonibacteria bacterium GW2011_GWA2_44_13b TaxID=1618647 RepID=A0A0G1JA37_9BACT|nr:MAG: hypothetical protein UW30_C0016G0003 [Candidatus Giovannonibacteria bacterium GW2011_GWA2_44_13b]